MTTYAKLTPTDGLKKSYDAAPYTTVVLDTGVAAMIDGNLGTSAGAGYFWTHGNGTVGIDLGSVKSVAKLVLTVKYTDINNNNVTWTAWGGGPYSAPIFKIYKSDDNTTWAFVETFSNITESGTFNFVLTNPAMGRYFKIVCDSDSSSPPGFTFTGGSGSPGGKIVTTELEAYDTVIECLFRATAKMSCNSIQIPGLISANASIQFNPVGTSTVVIMANHLQDGSQVGAVASTSSAVMTIEFEDFTFEAMCGALMQIEIEPSAFLFSAAAHQEYPASLAITFPAFTFSASAVSQFAATFEETFPEFTVKAKAHSGLAAKMTFSIPFEVHAEAGPETGKDATLEIEFPDFSFKATASIGSRFLNYILRYAR